MLDSPHLFKEKYAQLMNLVHCIKVRCSRLLTCASSSFQVDYVTTPYFNLVEKYQCYRSVKEVFLRIQIRLSTLAFDSQVVESFHLCLEGTSSPIYLKLCMVLSGSLLYTMHGLYLFRSFISITSVLEILILKLLCIRKFSSTP